MKTLRIVRMTKLLRVVRISRLLARAEDTSLNDFLIAFKTIGTTMRKTLSISSHGLWFFLLTICLFAALSSLMFSQFECKI